MNMFIFRSCTYQVNKEDYYIESDSFPDSQLNSAITSHSYEPPIILYYDTYESFESFLNITDDLTMFETFHFYDNYDGILNTNDYLAIQNKLKSFPLPIIKDYDNVYIEYYYPSNKLFIDYVIDGTSYKFVLNIVSYGFDQVLCEDNQLKEISDPSNNERIAIKNESDEICLIYEKSSYINRLIVFSSSEDPDNVLKWFNSIQHSIMKNH